MKCPHWVVRCRILLRWIRRRLSFYIPGTKNFKHRLIAVALGSRDAVLHKHSLVETLKQCDSKEVRRAIRAHAFIEASYQSSFYGWRQSWLFIATCNWIILVIAYFLPSRVASKSEWAVSGALILITSSILVAKRIMRPFSRKVIVPLMAIAITGIPPFYLIEIYPRSFLLHLWFATSLAAFLGPVTAAVGCVEMARRLLSKEPITAASMSMLDAIYHLHNGNLFMDFALRRRIISNLRTAANRIEAIPKRLTTFDEVSDSAFVNFSERAAAAMRSLFSWVLTPQDQTSEELKQRLITDYLLILRGRWGDLPQCDTRPKPEGNGFRPWARVRHFVTGMLSALSLLSAALLLHRLGFLSDAKHYEWAVIAGSAWACFYVMWVCDPLLPSRLATIRAAIEMLPMIGKKKD
jgi:hypothetical protein